MPRQYTPRVQRTCEYCEKPFLVQPCRVAKGHARFCSQRCATIARNSSRSLEERFWSKVDKSEECWIWTASRNGDGYGHVGVNGKSMGAHRISYELHFGPIPEGASVCHTCDNPPCVNPAHLFLGTHQGNMADRDAKGRGAHLKGEDNGHSKLTENDIRNIRERCGRYRKNGATQLQLSEEFGVSRAVIGMIVRRKAWAHVE